MSSSLVQLPKIVDIAELNLAFFSIPFFKIKRFEITSTVVSSLNKSSDEIMSLIIRRLREEVRRGDLPEKLQQQ